VRAACCRRRARRIRITEKNIRRHSACNGGIQRVGAAHCFHSCAYYRHSLTLSEGGVGENGLERRAAGTVMPDGRMAYHNGGVGRSSRHAPVGILASCCSPTLRWAAAHCVASRVCAFAFRPEGGMAMDIYRRYQRQQSRRAAHRDDGVVAGVMDAWGSLYLVSGQRSGVAFFWRSFMVDVGGGEQNVGCNGDDSTLACNGSNIRLFW